jgi:DNA repair protein RecO (recombination protein O)
MPLIKDQAVAIRRLDYSETSQVLVFFTLEHGKQRLIAKGIKRGTKARFATGIDLLEYGQVVFSRREEAGGGLGTLTEWRQEDVFSSLRTDLRWIYAAQYAAEAVDQSTEENDAASRLFLALVGLLRELPKVGLPALVRFQRVLLEEIGLMPDLTRCVVCGRPWPGKTAPLFSARQGGLVCRDCEGPVVEKRRIKVATAFAVATGEVNEATAPEAFDLLDYHLTESLGRQLRVSHHVHAGFMIMGQRL